MKRFFKSIKKHPEKVNEKDIEDYLSNYGTDPATGKSEFISADTIKLNKNGILFYYNRILRKDFRPYFPIKSR